MDFNKMPCVYWSDITKINCLQRRIIIYSIMYYELNESCISDIEFDKLSKQLVKLQSECSEKEFKKTKYYYVLHDFDGSTGYDIYSKLNKQDKEYLFHLAEFILDKWKREIAIKENGK